MVGSIRRGALIVGMVCGGFALAWGWGLSQQPTKADGNPNTSKAAENAPEDIIDIRENGNAIKCRVLSRWMDNGTLAYELQNIETGEKLTIVEDGPCTTFESKGGRLKAQSTRIFHWARSKTPPPGCPVPPMIVSGSTTIAPKLGFAPSGSANCQPGNCNIPYPIVQHAVPGTEPRVISEGPAFLVDVTPGAGSKSPPRLLSVSPPAQSCVEPPQATANLGSPVAPRVVFPVPMTEEPGLVNPPRLSTAPAVPGSRMVQGPSTCDPQPILTGPVAPKETPNCYPSSPILSGPVAPRNCSPIPGMANPSPLAGPVAPRENPGNRMDTPNVTLNGPVAGNQPVPPKRRFLDRILGRPIPAPVNVAQGNPPAPTLQPPRAPVQGSTEPPTLNGLAQGGNPGAALPPPLTVAQGGTPNTQTPSYFASEVTNQSNPPTTVAAPQIYAQGAPPPGPSAPTYETQPKQPPTPSPYGSPARLPRSGVVQRPMMAGTGYPNTANGSATPNSPLNYPQMAANNQAPAQNYYSNSGPAPGQFPNYSSTPMAQYPGVSAPSPLSPPIAQLPGSLPATNSPSLLSPPVAQLPGSYPGMNSEPPLFSSLGQNLGGYPGMNSGLPSYSSLGQNPGSYPGFNSPSPSYVPGVNSKGNASQLAQNPGSPNNRPGPWLNPNDPNAGQNPANGQGSQGGQAQNTAQAKKTWHLLPWLNKDAAKTDSALAQGKPNSQGQYQGFSTSQGGPQGAKVGNLTLPGAPVPLAQANPGQNNYLPDPNAPISPFPPRPFEQGNSGPDANLPGQGNPIPPPAFAQGTPGQNNYLPGQTYPGASPFSPIQSQSLAQSSQTGNPFLPGTPSSAGQSALPNSPGQPNTLGGPAYLPGQPTNPFLAAQGPSPSPYFTGTPNGFQTAGQGGVGSPLTSPSQNPNGAQPGSGNLLAQNQQSLPSTGQTANAGPKSFTDRVRELMHGKDVKTPGTQQATNDRAPFSTAITPDTKLPAASPLENRAATAQATPPALPLDKRTTTPQATPPAEGWHRQWGRETTPKNQQPGQATVEQAKSPGFTVPTMPPAADKGNALLDPDRLGLGENKIQRTSYQTKVEPKKEEKKEPAPKVAKIETPKEAPKKAPPAAVADTRPAQQLPPQQAYQPRMPPGVQSVLAANNGIITPISYVPVPVVTIPNPIRPPVPPAPSMPDAPQPAQYLQYNAFSGPQTPPGQGQPMYGPNPYAGYRGPMMPQAQPYGYPPQMNQRPVAMINYPMQYTGPQAPNPVGYQPMVQQMPPHYTQMPPMVPPQMYTAQMPPMMAGLPQMPPMQVNPYGFTNVNSQGFQQQLAVLREAPSPAQREIAVTGLATCDWRTNPQILEAVVTAARNDPAASVRAACCTALNKMNANVPPAMGALQALKADTDQRVRVEADQALIRLTSGTAQATTTPPIRPAQAQ